MMEEHPKETIKAMWGLDKDDEVEYVMGDGRVVIDAKEAD